MEAEIFFDSYLTMALQRALDYAGEEGFVASLPQLLHARTNASYDNIIWNTWFTTNSEENITRTPQGNHVLVTIHGGGIFATPERYETLFRADTNRFNELSYTGLFAAKLTDIESSNMLEGRMPDGTEIPVYLFEEFKKGITDLPHRYAVIMDFDMAKACKCGYESIAELKGDPLMIVRAGGVEAADAYLEKACARHNTKKTGSWHPFKMIRDPDQSQARVPTLAGNRGGIGTEDDDGHLYGYDTEYGMGGDSRIHSASMINIARYVAVAPRSDLAQVRNLSFNSP